MYTLERIAKENDISKSTARNYLTPLRKKGLVTRSGKIYKITQLPQLADTGFFSISDTTPVKLHETHLHQVHGKKYTVEDAIIYALDKNESRYLAVAAFLCNKITHWTSLVAQLKKKQLLPRFKSIYTIARNTIRVRKMPLRYQKMFTNINAEPVHLNENDVWSYKYD